MMYCTKCGAVIQDGITHCQNCGMLQTSLQKARKSDDNKKRSNLNIIVIIILAAVFIFIILPIIASVAFSALFAGAIFNLGDSTPSSPVAVIKVADNPDTITPDLTITHQGGTTLEGGNWKISIVPKGKKPVFLPVAEKFSAGNRIIAATTTENAASLTGASLTGGNSLSTGTVYEVMTAHIPSNAQISYQVFELRESSENLIAKKTEPIPSQTSSTPIQTPALGIPKVLITAARDTSTSTIDLIILHKSGDTIKGGDWKLSVVPEKTQSIFITSPLGSNFSKGNKITLFTTTENAIDPTNRALNGGVTFSTGKRYGVKIVHIPTNVSLLDTVVTIR